MSSIQFVPGAQPDFSVYELRKFPENTKGDFIEGSIRAARVLGNAQEIRHAYEVLNELHEGIRTGALLQPFFDEVEKRFPPELGEAGQEPAINVVRACLVDPFKNNPDIGDVTKNPLIVTIQDYMIAFAARAPL